MSRAAVNIADSGQTDLATDLQAVQERFAHLHTDRRDLSDVMARWKRFISDESVERGAAFSARAGDVMIATHAKAGTTMMQQIVFALRGGGVEFEEVSEVVPWLEMASDAGQDLQAAPVRAYKTHFGWSLVPKGDGVKHVCVVRDCHDVIVSMYHFLLNWFYLESEMSLADFVLVLLYQRGTPWWSHVVGWLRAAEQHPDDVLVVFYEDLVEHRGAAVRRVAQFIGATDETAIANAIERSSFEYMKAHASQFDEHCNRQRRDHVFGAVGDVGGKASKVRAGLTGKSAEQLGELKNEIDAVLGVCLPREHPRAVATYDALRKDAYASQMNVFRPA